MKLRNPKSVREELKDNKGKKRFLFLILWYNRENL